MFQVLYVLCFTRPRYQVSIYRTIGPLVEEPNFKIYVCVKGDIDLPVAGVKITSHTQISRDIGLFKHQLLLAHLSRRLTGELIGYPWIRCPVCPSSSVRPFTFSNVFSSETAWPIKAKFYVEPNWEGGTKVYINGPGHMTKMAATPIYGKNPSKIFFSRTSGPFSRNFVCSIGDSCPSYFI